MSLERNFSLLKVDNYYTVAQASNETADENAVTKRGVTYLKFIDNAGSTQVQMRHGDGVTALKNCPSIGYTANGILVGGTELTEEALQKILAVHDLISDVWTGEGAY